MVKPHESKEQARSNAIDRILTGKYTAIPAFVGIMALVFYLTFNVVGAALQDLLAAGIDALTALVEYAALTSWQVNAAVHSTNEKRHLYRCRQCAELFAGDRSPCSSSSLCWRIPVIWPVWPL